MVLHVVIPPLIHSTPAFLALKLSGWGQTIYLGIAFAAFRSLPSTSRMKFLLTNHHLLSYRLLHHILQTYHPLYIEDASDNIVEQPQQQFFDSTARHIVKLQIQGYYGAYVCYLPLEVYLNDSSKTLVDATDLRIFSSVVSVFEIYFVPLVLTQK